MSRRPYYITQKEQIKKRYKSILRNIAHLELIFNKFIKDQTKLHTAIRGLDYIKAKLIDLIDFAMNNNITTNFTDDIKDEKGENNVD